MFLLAASLAIVLHQDSPDPYQLAIGRPGTVVAQSGRITGLSDGRAATADQIARDADGKRFVFLGEQHATAPCQQLEADVIQALVRRGRNVVIGLEMYQRPKQGIIDQWVDGRIDEATFLERSDWKGQWGFPFEFYRPVFDVASANHLAVLGLNVPRDWVRAVGKGGFAALPAEAKDQLPANMSLDNRDHRTVFDALMGGHPGMPDGAMANVYAAQVLWDEGMADTIARDIQSAHRPANTVYVVIAGSGHIMYGQGIDYRLARRGLGSGVIVVMAESSQPITVANGLADYVYVCPKPRAD